MWAMCIKQKAFHSAIVLRHDLPNRSQHVVAPSMGRAWAAEIVLHWEWSNWDGKFSAKTGIPDNDFQHGRSFQDLLHVDRVV